MQLKLNTILHTKDGRKVGNAIITAEKNGLFEITTDYGNKLTNFTSNQIHEWFYIAWVDINKELDYYTCEEMQEYVASNHKYKV